MNRIEENRLTATDRAAIKARLIEVREQLRIHSVQRIVRHNADNVLTLEHVGWHAIGCSSADLRDSELAEITSMVHEVLR